MRFFCAAIIAFGHSIGYLNTIDREALYKLGIPSLVVFFHVLSGFTLAYIYPQLNGRAQVFRFWLARIGRIWPVHIFILALFVVFIPGPQAFDTAWWWCLAAHATLTQCWFPFTNISTAFNGPAWTLSTEFALYLLFPLLIQRWRKIWCWALPAFFLMALGLVIFTTYLGSLAGPLRISSVHFIYIHPVMRLFEFSAGMTLALFWRKAFDRYRPGISLGTALELCALGLGLTAMLGSPAAVAFFKVQISLGVVWSIWLERMLFPLIPYACLIMIFSLNKGWISRAFSSRWLVYLGELSFSLYLVHTLLIKLMMSDVSTPLRAWGVSVAYWCCSLLAAHLLYTLLEQPARRFFRKLLPIQNVKSIPDPAFERPSLKSKWRVPALEFAVLAVLLSTVIAEKKFHRHLQFLSETEAKKLIKMSAPNLGGLQFGDGFVLEGVIHQWSESGLQLQLVWRCLRDQRLDYVVAVHCIGHDGTLLGGADHPQEINQCRISAGERWVDTVVLRNAQLKEATSIGLGMYRQGEDLTPIDHGTRDWRDRRLLIDITSQLPPQPTRSQQ